MKKILSLAAAFLCTLATAYSATNWGETVLVDPVTKKFLDPAIVPSNSIVTMTGSVVYASVAGVASNALNLGGIPASAYLTNAPASSPTNWASFPALANVNGNGKQATNFTWLETTVGGTVKTRYLNVTAGFGLPTAVDLDQRQLLDDAAAPSLGWNGSTVYSYKPLSASQGILLGGYGVISVGPYVLSSNGLLYSQNNLVLTNAPASSPTNWASYPALADVDMGTNDFSRVNNIYGTPRVYTWTKGAPPPAADVITLDIGQNAFSVKGSLSGTNWFKVDRFGAIWNGSQVVASNGLLYSGGNSVLTSAPGLQDVLDAGNTSSNDVVNSGDWIFGGAYMTDGTTAQNATSGVQIVNYQTMTNYLGREKLVFVNPTYGSDVSGTGSRYAPFQTINAAMLSVPVSASSDSGITEWGSEKLIFELSPGVYNEDVQLYLTRARIGLRGDGVQINGSVTLTMRTNDLPYGNAFLKATYMSKYPYPWTGAAIAPTLDINGQGAGGVEAGYTAMNFQIRRPVVMSFPPVAGGTWAQRVDACFLTMDHVQLLEGCYVMGDAPNVTFEVANFSIQGGVISSYRTSAFPTYLKVHSGQLKSIIGPITVNEIDNCRIQGGFDATYGEVYGTHTGTNNAPSLVDTTKVWSANAYTGRVIYNDSDNSYGTVLSNTIDTIYAVLTNGTQNDWDTGEAYHLSPTSGVAQAIVFDNTTTYSGLTGCAVPSGTTKFRFGSSGTVTIYGDEFTLSQLAAKAMTNGTGTVKLVARDRMQGATTVRPTAYMSTATKGFQFFDTTVNAPYWWDGASWITMLTNAPSSSPTNWASYPALANVNFSGNGLSNVAAISDGSLTGGGVIDVAGKQLKDHTTEHYKIDWINGLVWSTGANADVMNFEQSWLKGSWNLSGNFYPYTTGVYDLGDNGVPLRWRNIHFSGTNFGGSFVGSTLGGTNAFFPTAYIATNYSLWLNASNYVYETTPDVGQKWIVSVSNNVAVTNIFNLR